jgi:hypothetical protein
MKFLVDGSTGVAVAKLLQEMGHAVNRANMARLVIDKYSECLTGAFTGVTERGIRIRKK